MAHDAYQLLISLSLDGELADDQQELLYEHMQACAACADMWSRMNALDRLLMAQPQVAPRADFTARVMARAQVREARRHPRPWMIALLVGLSALASISLLTPILLLSLGIYRIVMVWPWVGVALGAASEVFARLVTTATYLTNALIDWFTYLLTDPAALAVIIVALMVASTYIGLREGLRAPAMAEATRSA